ncbi:MAG: nitrophenyl compound nitroreductase subunit ArsF family protein [Bacteroidales bacterium]|jgi:thiol-disulfide isomerase/thioredoxin|nr:nitrophenyl compound nitroreductase subunit ArsF family protein [Bacteroidales bacterium]
MKKSIHMLTLVLFSLMLHASCAGQDKKQEKTNETAQLENVEVYYFHFSRRCTTCKMVEAEAEKSVQELYGDNVTFTSYNLDETEGEQKAESLNVAGQTLLIVGADGTQFNITNEGFMYARSNPAKLKQTIQEKINSL